MQSGVTLLGSSVDGSAPGEQFAHHIHVAVFGRQVDGVETVLEQRLFSRKFFDGRMQNTCFSSVNPQQDRVYLMALL